MIRLYSLYTPSHRVLKERFFCPTVPHDLELHLEYFENEGEGRILDPSWRRAVIRKVEVIIDAIVSHPGRVFVWSDVDAQFFAPVTEWVEPALANCDIAFQIDAPGSMLCNGFFFCRGTESTLQLWRRTLEGLRPPENAGDDQALVRRFVHDTPGLRWGLLPVAFCGGGTLMAHCWNPGDALPIPANAVMHHANWTIGVANKIAMCELVREKRARGDTVPAGEAEAIARGDASRG